MSPRATPKTRVLGEGAAPGEHAHHRPDEVPGHDDVEGGGQTEEEGEAAHRADGEHVEEDGADEAGRVGGDDRAEGPLEGAVGRGPQGAALGHLVLQPLEVHDIAVHRDAHRHHQAGDARQAEGEALALPQPADHRVVQRAPHGEAEDHHEPEGPVVHEHVEADEAKADEAGDEAGAQRVGAEGGRHGLDGLGLEGDRQRAVPEDEGQVLGLPLA